MPAYVVRNPRVGVGDVPRSCGGDHRPREPAPPATEAAPASDLAAGRRGRGDPGALGVARSWRSGTSRARSTAGLAFARAAPGRLAVPRLSSRSVAASRSPTRREWVSIVAIGVLWFGIYNVTLNAGEQHVDAGTAVDADPGLAGAGRAARGRVPRREVHDVPRPRPRARLRRRRPDRDGIGDSRTAASPASSSASSPRSSTRQPGPPEAAGRAAARHPRHLARLHDRCDRLPAVRRASSSTTLGDASARRHLVGRLPRRLPDRDRVHHLRLRAADHDASSLGVTTYLVPPITIVMGWLFLDEGRPRWRTSAARSPWSASPWPAASHALPPRPGHAADEPLEPAVPDLGRGRRPSAGGQVQPRGSLTAWAGCTVSVISWCAAIMLQLLAPPFAIGPSADVVGIAWSRVSRPAGNQGARRSHRRRRSDGVARGARLVIDEPRAPARVEADRCRAVLIRHSPRRPRRWSGPSPSARPRPNADLLGAARV